MTQIHNTEHFNGTSIDLLVGGTPCQSFSVAGLRKGLDDTRGQLMLTFCELAARKRPKWVVWENVPGVLSSNKGEDLASFLGLLTGREIHPPVGGWKNSGVVEGIGSAYGVAWTVLDAQHFGVAQRRRRIFAVGYLGDWRPAAAVLFEHYRLSGNPSESRKKRKATSSDAQGGVGGGGIPRVSGSLDTECGGGKLTHQSVNNGHLVPVGFRMTAFGEYANDNSASTLKQRDYKDATDLVTHAFKVRGGVEENSGEQGGTPGKKAGKGYLGSDELAFTLSTTQDQQIAQPIAFQSVDYGGDATINLSPTLRRHDPMAVAQPIAYENHPQDSRVREMGDTCTTVTSNYGMGGGNVPLVGQPIAVDCYNQTINEHTTQTIGASASDVNHYGAVLQPNISPTITQCKGSRGGSSMEALDEISAIHAQQPTMAIRRLTPRECERLQGFPDDWTLIPYRNKSTDQCPDGPRYKACGNSMAVPVMAWIGKRIQMVEDVMHGQNGRQVD
jgi:DNA (cytosine-5)-methyltransferase 1